MSAVLLRKYLGVFGNERNVPFWKVNYTMNAEWGKAIHA